MSFIKPIVFLADSLASLRRFPPAAKQRAGRQLFAVQCGQEPTEWKPMKTIGAGVREIRLRDESGIYRILYVAASAGRVHVLHCFQKKTQKTSRSDIELAARRYKDLVQEQTR